MADVYRRPNSPYYYFDITVGGKRQRRSTGRTKIAEARAVREAELRKLLDNTQLGEKPITLREALFDHYLPSRAKKASYRDLVRYCHTLCGDRKEAASLGGDIYLHEITTTMLERYRARRIGQGLAEQTIDHELKCLVTANRMVRGEFRTNPKLEVPMARVKGKARYLTPDEETALLEELNPLKMRAKGGGWCFIRPSAPVAVQRADNYDLAVMLLDTGARFGEIAKLTWDNVDTKDFAWLRIRRTKVQNEGVLATTKRLQEVLRRRWSQHKGYYVFPGWNTNSHRRQTGAIRRAMNRVGINRPDKVEWFGRRDVRSLRDTFATKLRRNGMSLDRIQVLLGHASPAMTQKYADVGLDQVSVEAAAMLDRLDAEAERWPKIEDELAQIGATGG